MKLTGISPVLLVADLERSVEYYRDRLGFECEVYGDPPDFAAARRDDATLLLALCADPERIVPNWKIVDNIWNAYIRVDDADAVYEEVQRRGAESTTRSTTRRMGSASSASKTRTATTSPSASRSDRPPNRLAVSSAQQCRVANHRGREAGREDLRAEGHDVRPTGDRVREAAFNLIGPVDGASVLDLFAGSGATGSRRSRGAARAVFAEADRAAYDSIRQNVQKLRLTGATILHRDAIQVLAEEAAAGRRYDLVLLDPPYRMFSSLQDRIALYLPAVLAQDGLAVVETHAKEEPELPCRSGPAGNTALRV